VGIVTPLRSVAGWLPELIEVSRLQIPGEDMAPAGVLGEHVEVPTNVLLLTGHGSTVLVDAGEGLLAPWYPCEGIGLRAGLYGREPDLIVLTHLDFDHLGGVLAGAWPEALTPAFPSTPVVVLDAAARAARGADPDRPWNSGTRSVEMLDRAGLLREVADGEEIAAGLRLRAAPGHRSGHAVLGVGNGLLHLADVIHHVLHVGHPDWGGHHDGDPSLALRTRVALLEEAAARRTLCVSSHVRGAGHVVRSGDALRWMAL
jgi:glyoxylase-like metal-dependent hydrolase (beta-lactamase superfamily II)